MRKINIDTLFLRLSIFILFTISIIFIFIPNSFSQVIQQPDTALALVGLALVVVFIFRELAKQKIRGLIAVLFNIKREDVIEHMSSGWRLFLMKGGYWFAVGLLLFASINLLIGTITEVRTYGTEITHQDIQELIDSNERQINQLVERIDRLIEVMEASGNVRR